MKKIIALFISILLTITMASAEIVDESFYVGTWVHFAMLTDGGFTYTLFRLEEDHTAYFSIRHVPADLDSSGRENIKTWSASGNNVEIVTGNVSLDLFVTDDYRLARKIYGGYEIYERVGSSENNDNSTSSSLAIPSGVYVAGEDFPAGTYRIELENEKNTGVIVLYENMEDTKRAFSYLYEYSMTKSSPVVGKMIIEPGNVLDVRNTVVVLLPYEGLK